jgi:hypothetical protein
MRIILIACLLLAGLASASAEPQRLAEGERLEGRFVQERQLKGFDAPLKSEGRFSLVPKKGLLWQSEKPFETTTVITAAGIVQLVGGAEASRLPASRAPFIARFADMLSAALTGDTAALDRDFEVKRQDGPVWRLEIAPKQKEGPVAQQIEKILVSGTRFAEEVEVLKPGGDRERLKFLSQRVVTGPLAPEDERLLAVQAQ